MKTLRNRDAVAALVFLVLVVVPPPPTLLFASAADADDNDDGSSPAVIGPPLRTVGDSLFRSHPYLEASGLVWLGDSANLLAGVCDTGSVFFVDPDDDDRWYVAASIDGLPNDYDDLEGVAVDTGLVLVESGGEDGEEHEERPHGSHLYVLSENPPALIKITYTLPTTGHEMTVVFESKADVAPGVLPDDFDKKKGLEALTLYSPSSPDDDGGGRTSAVFLVGLQDDGRVYAVDSAGDAVPGLGAFDGGLDGGLDGESGISGLHYDAATGVLFSVYDKRDKMAAVDVTHGGCILGTWSTEETQEEGLALRLGASSGAGDVVYIASDEGGKDGDPSFIAEHAFDALNLVPSSCGGTDSSFCGDGTCGDGEDCASCPADCPGKTSGSMERQYCCVAGTCEGRGCQFKAVFRQRRRRRRRRQNVRRCRLGAAA